MSDILARLDAELSDRYRIEREIGAGGMATVYLARDLKHGRPVALKVLRPELSAILGTERFFKEIELTAHLRHPHILPLHDSGAADGLLYYVMPFVSGESLRQKLARERQLSVTEAVEISVQVATALEYAHGQGLIHRDIKPENILLEAGQAVVTDFGIALAVRTAGGARLTETGLSLGTPQYMSPEQAAGDRELDPRTDVYSCACVTYEMLAGDPPLAGSTVQAVITKVLTEIPRPLTDIRRTIPGHVSDAVAQALEKLPADRFATAAQFAAALEGQEGTVVARRSSGARQAQRRSRRASMMAVVAATVVTLLAGALAGVAWSARRSGPTLDRWSIALPNSAPLDFVGSASLGLGLPALAVSPDAGRIAYAGRQGDGTALFVHEVGSFEVRLLPGTEGAFHPFFSPDGNEVAFYAGGRLKKVAVAGGSPVVLADVVEPHGGVWNEQDRIIVADHEGTRLSIIPAAGGALTRVGGRQRGILSPSAIPGSPWLLHAIPSTSGILAVTSIESGETRYLRRNGPPVSLVSIASPDILYGIRPFYVRGYLVYLAPGDGRLLARRFDPRTLEVKGDAFTVLEGVRVEVGGGQIGIGGGALAYATGGDMRSGRLVWGDAAGRLDTLPVPPGAFGSFDISPTGKRLVLPVGTTDGPPEIQVLDLEHLSRGPQERWRPPPGVAIPKWSPDERWIALGLSMGYDRASAYRVWLPLGGRVDTLSDNFLADSFTPDGQSMLGIAVDSVGVHLARLPLDGGTATRLHSRSGDQIFAALSPGGDWLAYMSSEAGTWEIYIEPFPGPGQRRKVSIAGGNQPVWSPKGDRLYYRYRNTLYVARVDKSTGEVGTPTEFISGPLPNVPGYPYAVSPDGERLLLILGPSDQTANHIRVIRDFASELRHAEAGRQR